MRTLPLTTLDPIDLDGDAFVAGPLRALCQPDCLRRPGATVLGLALPFEFWPNGRAKPRFPLQVLAQVHDQAGDIDPPRLLLPAEFHEAATPKGWALFGQAQADFLLAEAVYYSLMFTAEALYEDHAALRTALPQPNGAYADICAVIAPQGAVLYTEWLGPLSHHPNIPLPSTPLAIRRYKTTSAHDRLAQGPAIINLARLVLRQSLLARYALHTG